MWMSIQKEIRGIWPQKWCKAASAQRRTCLALGWQFSRSPVMLTFQIVGNCGTSFGRVEHCHPLAMNVSSQRPVIGSVTGQPCLHQLRLLASCFFVAVLPDSLREVISLMLNPDPSLRPDIDHLLTLPIVIKQLRRRNWCRFQSYLEKYLKEKFSAIKRVWHTMLCFLASLLVFGQRKTVVVEPAESSSTPSSPSSPSHSSAAHPEIHINDNSFSDGAFQCI